MKDQVGITEPTRDWFPLSLMGAFADFADLVHGPGADWGQVSCGCHPNCGVGTAMMINKETKEIRSGPAVPEHPGSCQGHAEDHGRRPRQVVLECDDGLALLKNYNPFGAPHSLTLMDILKKFDKSFGLTGKNYGKVSGDRTDGGYREAPPGSVELPVHRRHVVPGSLQLRLPPHRDVHHSVRDAGRRDFLLCVQHGHRLAEDHREHVQERDRRGVVRRARPTRDLRAEARKSNWRQGSHNMVLNPIDLTRPNKPEMEGPKTAHEEAVMMRKLYQELVLKKQLDTKEADKPVQIQGLSRKKAEVLGS